MIKDITLALLTTTINRYSSLGDSIRAIHKEVVINDLTDILDYVTDLKEENNQPITVVLNSNGEVEFLKKRIRELEESCETDNEVIEKQHRKIKELQNSNYRWHTLCNQLREKNKRFETENKDLKSRFGVDKLEIMKRGGKWIG